jgi:glycosyltransferase involved in cell wall biosynthesis
VVIPAYNYGRFLPDALGSVVHQSVDDLELIVVDDGSTDDTATVLAGWSDPRLTVIRQANAGIMAARQAGLAMARGRYLAFLDADDLWHPTYLSRQLAVLESERSVGFCFTDFVRTSEGLELAESQFDHAPGLRRLPTRTVAADAQARIIDGDAFAALAPLAEMPGWLQATVFRREVVEGLRIRPEVTRGEDLYLMLQAYVRARVAFIDETLVEVRRHGGNSYLSSDEVRAGILEVVQLILDDIPLSRDQRSILRHRVGAEYLRRGWRYFWGHRPREAGSYYMKALAWPGTRASALGHLAALPLLPLLPHKEPPF